ncbi:MAG: DUF72 domain-containing protein [Candidatus Bathyarchaeota archaeon]|nr:DUF72 domain-containing protein [Candidatus Bathyarchaeota archaeon]
MTDYLIGTGGWAYFKVPNKPPLKAYSEIFNFVEVNYTFYEYPDMRMVEQWRKTVPEGFTFAVRCHQDLTHRIGLKPVDEAYSVLSKMISYCKVLDAPFLVLETPVSYVINNEDAERARDLFSSSRLRGVRLVWELRATLTKVPLDLMRDLNIIECVDLSTGTPSVESNVVYSRLFGKGKHNIYQFTDDELLAVDRKVKSINPRIVALSYHGVRMNIDAARFMQYRKTGQFIPVTDFTGVNSARAVLVEDAQFPLSKSKLIEKQGWKVIDLTLDKRVHLSEFLAKVPDKTYNSIDEVAAALEAVM